MSHAVLGWITRWRPATGDGLLRLADMRPLQFDRSALAHGSGEPSIGQCVLVVHADGDVVRRVHAGGRATHPSTPRHAPFRASIESVACADALGRVGGLAYHEQACVGFSPVVGDDVWVASYGRGDEPVALTLYAVDGAPPEIEGEAAAAREHEAAEEREHAAAREQRTRGRVARRSRAAADDAYAARAAANGWHSEADDPLLAAVLENPDDDDVRRVFADRLLAEGSHYGEYIAMQLAPARDLAHEAELRRQLAARWLPPRGAFRDVVFERGFLARATLHALDRGAALRADWRLGTLEWLVVDRKSERGGDWLAAYTELVTAPTATTLRTIDARAIEVVRDCPAFRAGRLTGITKLPIRAYARLDPTELDWVTDIHVEVPDREWGEAMHQIEASLFAGRRVHISNRGCSYVDRREDVVTAWQHLPVSMIAVWDVALERTLRGTLARFAGWRTATSTSLLFPGIQMLAHIARHVPDLYAIETHGSAPPTERELAELAAALPAAEVRHVVRPLDDRAEGTSTF